MKIFYYTIVKNNRGRYGRNFTANIYTVKGKEIQYCCSRKWNTASYRGEKSEVFQSLMNNGFIPKKYNNSSKCEWRGAGYFDGVVTEKYDIRELPKGK